jgi:hypothetical protein
MGALGDSSISRLGRALAGIHLCFARGASGWCGQGFEPECGVTVPQGGVPLRVKDRSGSGPT